MKSSEQPKEVKRRSKGVKKSNVKSFTHMDYRKVFFTEIQKSTNCKRMQSKGHVMYNIAQEKVALSHADDKRAWLSNNYSLPYGNCKIPYFEQHPPRDVEDCSIRKRSTDELYDEIFRMKRVKN